MSLQLNITEILRLALEGTKEDVINAVRTESARLVSLKEEYTNKLASVNKDLAMLDSLPIDNVGNKSTRKGMISEAMHTEGFALRPQSVDAGIKNKRDSAIIVAAKELGGIYDQFTTVSIANELKNKGIETGVPENRISTVISRLLLRHEQEFEKVETGIYKLKNA